MNAAESVLPIYAGIITDSLRLQFAGVFVCPATETVFGIEKQITGCFAAAGKQSALSSMLQMKAVKFLQIDIRQNIYIMNQDRKSTRLNSSHANISYAVFCLKKKKTLVDLADVMSTTLDLLITTKQYT